MILITMIGHVPRDLDFPGTAEISPMLRAGKGSAKFSVPNALTTAHKLRKDRAFRPQNAPWLLVHEL